MSSIDAPTYGEGYDLGVVDGREQGRAQRAGEIVAGIIARARESERTFGVPATVLRDLAAEIKAGAL